MGSEIMLLGYGAVCLSMLVFNVINSLVMKKKELRLDKRCRKLEDKVQVQIGYIKDGRMVEEEHIRYLSRRLSFVKNLAAFDRVMEHFPEGEEDGAAWEYRKQIQPAVLHLAFVYSNRSDMEAAYFAWFLSKNIPKEHRGMDAAEEIMVQYMKKRNLYCRVNALDALYGFGSEESVVKALTLLSQEGGFIHEKILTDGLLTFTGSHEKLIKLLWENFGRLSDKMQLAVLSYIRFKSGGYCESMFEIMTDPGRDKEQRLMAIRYFGRYFYEPALEPLLAFASDLNPLNWEYAAISASSLAKYSGEKVILALMAGVHSPNWHVRYNAAASLEASGPDDWETMDAAGRNDRYAREMLMYRMELKRVRETKRRNLA